MRKEKANQFEPDKQVETDWGYTIYFNCNSPTAAFKVLNVSWKKFFYTQEHRRQEQRQLQIKWLVIGKIKHILWMREKSKTHLSYSLLILG